MPKPPKKRSRRNFLGRRQKQSTSSRQPNALGEAIPIIMENIIDDIEGGDGAAVEIEDVSPPTISSSISSQQQSSTRSRNDNNW